MTSNKSFHLEKSLEAIKKMNEDSYKNSEDFYRLIYSLPCGTTVAQFIELYREPDNVELRAERNSGGRYLYFAFYWGKNSVRIYDSSIRKDRPRFSLSLGTYEQFIKAAKNTELEMVHDQFDFTSWAGSGRHRR